MIDCNDKKVKKIRKIKLADFTVQLLLTIFFIHLVVFKKKRRQVHMYVHNLIATYLECNILNANRSIYIFRMLDYLVVEIYIRILTSILNGKSADPYWNDTIISLFRYSRLL